MASRSDSSCRSPVLISSQPTTVSSPPVPPGTSDSKINNNRSVSLASVSSEGSNESHVATVATDENIAISAEVRNFREAVNNLRNVFQVSNNSPALRVVSHERLGEVLRILQHILERVPILQSDELLSCASQLIHRIKVTHYDDDEDDKSESSGGGGTPEDFHVAVDLLVTAFNTRLSEYLIGDSDAAAVFALSSSNETILSSNKSGRLHPEEVDAILMKHDQAVDHALMRAKVWSKYAKDIINYVDKRTTLEIEVARNLTKLALTMKPLLKEESYLPFQSIFCTALDQDLEMCAITQSTCSLLQGYKFLEPLANRRVLHEKTRKSLKDRWHKEVKRMHESISNLRKANCAFMQRQQEYYRCREAVRIAEHGAEIGATGDNKVDKRKRLEEEAYNKTIESENAYRECIADANERHRNLLSLKGTLLKQIRQLIFQCDQTMKMVTVDYFKLQQSMASPIAIQYQTLCESSRLYEPGSQFMEYVRRLPEPRTTRFLSDNPFVFEPYSEEQMALVSSVPNTIGLNEKSRKTSGLMDLLSESSGAGIISGGGTYKLRGDKSQTPLFPWSSTTAVTRELSDTESVESRESYKSRDTSPSASPIIPSPYSVTQDESDYPTNNITTSSATTSTSSSNIVHPAHVMSKAAVSHHFRKLKTPSRCRECDSYVYFQGGFECTECGLAAHKKCLETLTLQCGHKRLPRKVCSVVFGVNLCQHLREMGTQIPPLIMKCVHQIDQRASTVKGIYRISSVKSKTEKLCAAYESSPELVDLTDIHHNVIADILKLYLRQLPEPLITFALYPEFIQAMKTFTSNEELGSVVSMLCDLCRRLPKAHFLTLGYLMHHLRRISSYSDVNSMPASNLAIVFAPSLLRSADGNATLSTLTDTEFQTKIIELLIIHANTIFGLSDVFVAECEKNEPQIILESTTNPILEQYLAAASDEDDAEPLPDFLQPHSQSPQLRNYQSTTAPLIIKQSLKNFSGLEGITIGMLSAQDSIDVSKTTYECSPPATTFSHPVKPKRAASVQVSFSDPRPVLDNDTEEGKDVVDCLKDSLSRAATVIGSGGRSCSLTEETSSLCPSFVQHRRHFQELCTPVDTLVSSKKKATKVLQDGGVKTIRNLEGNKVKIQVPGLLRSAVVSPQTALQPFLKKDSSLDKDKDNDEVNNDKDNSLKTSTT